MKTNTMNHVGRLLMLALLLGALPSAAETIYMPPFTYAGRLMNYMRIAYTDGVRVYARNTNGVLLAQTQVFKPDSSALNYALAVPLANAPTETTARPGDQLFFEVDDGVMLWSNQQIMPQAQVGNPGGVCLADIILEHDANGNGIADAYEAMIETLRFALLGLYEPYDPDADYDGDGMSNRDEYWAGTDPLNAADQFAIAAVRALRPTIEIEQERITIRFYAMRGRTYSLAASASLIVPAWEYLPFSLADTPDAPSMTTYLSPGAIEEEGMVTFYAVINDPKVYYRLRVE